MSVKVIMDQEEDEFIEEVDNDGANIILDLGIMKEFQKIRQQLITQKT